MRNKRNFFIGILVAILLVAYSATYTVRYDETAVVTVFEQANQDDLIDKPGLGFKAPWPISKIYVFPRKVQVLEDLQQQVQTADKKSVTLSMYVTWRIDKPYEFFQAVENIDTAEEQLRGLTQNLPSILSQYPFDALVNADPEKLKIDEIEKEATEYLQAREDEIGLGIAIEGVGIRRLQLPEAVTETVFAAMRSTREALAKNAESEGQAQASQIETQAESIKNRILAFAERTATAIRAEGQEDAARTYDVFEEEPALAILLKQLETLKNEKEAIQLVSGHSKLLRFGS